MENRKIATIDLGSQKLRLAVGEVQNDGGITVLYYNEFPSRGILHGRVLNPSQLGEAVSVALNAAENYLSLKIIEVMVNCQKYDIRIVEEGASIDLDSSRAISDEDLETLQDMVSDEVQGKLDDSEEILALVPRHFNTGDEMGISRIDIVGMMGEKLEGHYKIFIGKTSSLKNIDAAFGSTDIKLVRKAFVSPYIGHCCLSKSELETGAALIDFGAGACSVSVFHGGILRHYGAIPFGGRNVTADIVNLCGISDTLAENIKMGYGGCMPEKLGSLGEKTLKIKDIDNGDNIAIPAKYLSEIITARTKEILEALLYEIQLSGYADKLKNGVVVTGGGAVMMNLCGLIKNISGYKTRVGIPSRIKFNSDISSFFKSSSCTTAGLLERFSLTDADCTEDRHVIDLAGTPIQTAGKDDKPENREGDASGTAAAASGLLFPEEETSDGRQQATSGKNDKSGRGKDVNVKKRMGTFLNRFQNEFDKIQTGIFGQNDDPENQV